jgi:SAM-dependent methyltransferase
LTPLSLAPDLLPIMRCPACKSALAGAGDELSCAACGRRYPKVRGVFRFVDEGNYADSFGYQWHRFQRTQLDNENKNLSERDFIRKTGVKPEDFAGKLVLDVGCGMGRFAEVATRWGARVVGIDLSAAAEVAAKNLAEREFVALQADVFSLPFAPESFDCIYSMGVLHHTPDCEKAVKTLPQYLKPGGMLAVWLYSGYNKWYRFSDQYRKITHRMSPRALHNFFRVAVPFFYWLDRGLRVVPIVGEPVAGVIHHVFPVNRHRDAETRVLDTLDWYSPKYQSKHTYEQVFRWFESCGLEKLSVGNDAVGVTGRKPLSNGP